MFKRVRTPLAVLSIDPSADQCVCGWFTWVLCAADGHGYPRRGPSGRHPESAAGARNHLRRAWGALPRAALPHSSLPPGSPPLCHRACVPLTLVAVLRCEGPPVGRPEAARGDRTRSDPQPSPPSSRRGERKGLTGYNTRTCMQCLRPLSQVNFSGYRMHANHYPLFGPSTTAPAGDERPRRRLGAARAGRSRGARGAAHAQVRDGHCGSPAEHGVECRGHRRAAQGATARMIARRGSASL